ncbi:MAG: L-allo-threonine aldolase [Phycisphaerae bacterium]|nr:L-allo-threonine aldolase [Phycisphaerae bacterium]
MADETINLYSDTQTLPTEAMYEAMRLAPLGDDQQQLDPTVNRLEKMSADRCGKAAGLFVPSGMMGNLCGMMSLAAHGDEAIIDADAHFWWYEAGSMFSVAGVAPRMVPLHDGLLDPAEVRASVRPPDAHLPRPRVLWLENTHNRGGGCVTPISLHRELCAVAREHGLKVHLDGARIWNASVATGTPVRDYAAEVDTLTFCFSKGLSCPAGSVIVGSEEVIAQARRVRKRLGGAMRQAGVLAACAIVALEQQIERLADDHANAARLAGLLGELRGVKVINRVQTNMVFADVADTGVGARDLAARFKAAGVMVSVTGPTTIRLVTHRHITAAAVDEAARRMRKAIG